jgi:hypothetical protein
VTVQPYARLDHGYMQPVHARVAVRFSRFPTQQRIDEQDRAVVEGSISSSARGKEVRGGIWGTQEVIPID